MLEKLSLNKSFANIVYALLAMGLSVGVSVLLIVAIKFKDKGGSAPFIFELNLLF